jgi:hypothetical protein
VTKTPPALSDFEKLGAFYLGRTHDADDPGEEGKPYLYDARDLTTHAVVIGMTGSGKTGLSIALLEEAAIDGIPAIVVDPKGDLGNLLLAFPELRDEDFARWAPPGVDAASEASKWRAGLAEWGQDAARIQRLRAAADITLYTPGSRAGRPISITGSLAAPPPEVRGDAELVNERITQVATSLLGLVGVTAEPGKSREHVLVSTILQRAWAAGEDLDLSGLVLRIQEPPFERIGVLDVESFFPTKERFALAVAYNSLLASPGFDAWLDGEPLDVGKLLWTREGKPRVAILSIAHLDDAQRMFFVSLLLGQMVSWMRMQPGTPSLRALFFMDEVVGYFPPVAMPPSKPPLLLLLKQARAFGLGVVLATQNPVDLDYKGLSNAGTWLIGRLQTERDKARVIDGLEGAASGSSFDRETVDRTLSALKKRHFYVHDVHAARPVVIESRWTMSYLRGPLTRGEIRRLSGGAGAGPSTSAGASTSASPETVVMKAAGGERPAVPPEVPEVFFPTTVPRPLYRPWAVGAARVEFADAKTGLDFAREVMFVAPVSEGAIPLRWEDAKWAGSIGVRDLGDQPAPGARFLDVPGPLLAPKSYAAWSKKLVAWLASTQGVARWKSPALKTFSAPNEDEAAFRARLAMTAREARDRAAEELRAKYGTKLAALEERIRKAQQAVAREQEQANAQRAAAAFSLGGGLLGSFLGGSAGRAVTGATRAAKSASRAAKESRDAAREKDNLDVLVEKYRALQEELRAALAGVTSALDPSTAPLEQVVTKPKKTAITVHLVALGWRAEAT